MYLTTFSFKKCGFSRIFYGKDENRTRRRLTFIDLKLIFYYNIMDLIEHLKRKTASAPKRIVLADGEDIRAIRAADLLLREGLTSGLFLLGDPSVITRSALELGLSIDRANLVDPARSPDRHAYADIYLECHHHRISREQAFEEIAEVLNFGAMLVRQSAADCLIGGADHPTADLIKSAWWIIGMKPQVKTVSSSFLMILEDRNFGADGVLVFADCAVVPQPNPHQLADIAMAAAENFRSLTGAEPIVGLLSFSTKGSAEHPDVLKVRQAAEELKNRNPGLVFDGEIQFDAAVVGSICGKKAPGSPVAGKANVLIFPDLDAGNICYKIAERFGRARALGPLMQGLNKPVSDLSRGCSWQDICEVAVVTQNLA